MFSKVCRLQRSNREGSRFFSLKAVSDAFAVATAQAKRSGHKDFSEGSPGEKKRDEIAEAIKRKSKKN